MRKVKEEAVLTKTQDNRRKQVVLKALRKLVKAPQVKDLIREVQLGSYPDHNDGGDWGVLKLTKKGLVEQTGFYDKCMVPSDCDLMHDSYENDPKRVIPSTRLVDGYNLKEASLKGLLAKLRV